MNCDTSGNALEQLAQYTECAQKGFNALPTVLRMMIAMIFVGFALSQVSPMIKYVSIIIQRFGKQMKEEAKRSMMIAAFCGLYYIWTQPQVTMILWYVIGIPITGVVTQLMMLLFEAIATPFKNHTTHATTHATTSTTKA